MAGDSAQSTQQPPDAVEPCPLAKTWIEITLVDVEGNPVAGQNYQITAPDGKVVKGKLDGKGFAHVDGVQSGSCAITFPDLDGEAWEWV
jgi:hypothetical protein